MSISSFDDLIRVARQQPEPQRLLFVFTAVELPDDSTPEQRARFEAGNGGALTPLMCVDKTLEELGTFNDLLEESRQVLQEWKIVFVAALSGNNGRVPRSEDAEAALNRMVESIKAGSIGSFIPFDAHGQPVLFGPS
ncbi:ribonucleotide reductase subunit alpha [Trinickia sp. Y13]|uniref:ribonucleotide reductase subunit alpha n=1 Tax=Trinickia sp. Y13 TaxID=2917807 RepID=UPI002405B7E1|nr:ribonucleotide reductase subunit alpha [Trinickia sp. Y13]MDG0024649.1 ribonucleotide reductase subunit alpha [Trinickia sp. Y13]